jgi:hypothetical protein
VSILGIPSNENKVSDGGRERGWRTWNDIVVALGVETRRVAVRSTVWLDGTGGQQEENGEKGIAQIYGRKN